MRLLCVLLIACCCVPAADNPFLGMWRIDESKSRPDPSGPGITAYIVGFTVDNNGVLIGRAWASDGSARPNVLRYDGQEHAAAV